MICHSRNGFRQDSLSINHRIHNNPLKRLESGGECMLRKGRSIPEKSKKISLYNHFSLVRENHRRGEYHTSSYKEGSLFIDQFKATQKRPYWYGTHQSGFAPKNSCLGKYLNLRVSVGIYTKSNSSNRCVFVNSN